MERNAVAIAFKIVLFVTQLAITIGIFPFPFSLQQMPLLYAHASVALIWSGSLISIIGIFWKDRLDGGAIEQFGLIIAIIGLILYNIAAARLFPMTWFQFSLALVPMAAFVVRFFQIRKYRRALKKKGQERLARRRDGR